MSKLSGNAEEQLEEMSAKQWYGLQLKRCRKTWGLSQTWVAQKAGTTQRVVSLIEAGKYNPSLEVMERVAEALGMRLEVSLRRRPGKGVNR